MQKLSGKGKRIVVAALASAMLTHIIFPILQQPWVGWRHLDESMAATALVVNWAKLQPILRRNVGNRAKHGNHP
jgi:hypothetical protein